MFGLLAYVHIVACLWYSVSVASTEDFDTAWIHEYQGCVLRAQHYMCPSVANARHTSLVPRTTRTRRTRAPGVRVHAVALWATQTRPQCRSTLRVRCGALAWSLASIRRSMPPITPSVRSRSWCMSSRRCSSHSPSPVACPSALQRTLTHARMSRTRGTHGTRGPALGARAVRASRANARARASNPELICSGAPSVPDRLQLSRRSSTTSSTTRTIAAWSKWATSS